MARTLFRLGLLLSAILVACIEAHAQVGAGQITGVVTDGAGAPVPGATITATQVRNSFVRVVVSSSSGVYTLPALNPGQYRIDVGLTGFQPVRREGVTVRTGDTVRIDVVLLFGALTDAVTVEADAPMMRSSASLGQVISEEKVEALPLNGRSFIMARPAAPQRLGQGVFAVDGTLGSGYVQQWNLSVQRELTTNTSVEVSYVGSKITHVGVPDTNLNQLSVEQLALGNALLTRVPNPYFGVIPRSSSLGDPTITIAQLMKPYPRYATVSLYRNNVGTRTIVN